MKNLLVIVVLLGGLLWLIRRRSLELVRESGSAAQNNLNFSWTPGTASSSQGGFHPSVYQSYSDLFLQTWGYTDDDELTFRWVSDPLQPAGYVETVDRATGSVIGREYTNNYYAPVGGNFYDQWLNQLLGL